jgi:hypothetical protein
MTPSTGAEGAVPAEAESTHPNVVDARVADTSVIVPVLNEEAYLPWVGIELHRAILGEVRGERFR